MVLSCVTSENATLQYLGIGAQSVRVFRTPARDYNLEELEEIVTVRSNNPINLLTWEWEEQIWKRYWLLEGTWQSGYNHNCGESFNWQRATTQPTSSIDWQAEDGQPIGFYVPPDHPDIVSGNPRGHFVSIYGHPYFLAKVPTCTQGTYIPIAINATLDSVSPHPGGNGKWYLKFFENGEEITRLDLWGQMFDAPTDLINEVTGKQYFPVSKNFTKVLNTEALELLPVPDKEEEWQLWLVTLDAEQNSISSEVIYQFQGKEPQLFCLDENECPDNSCQVDCGTHYCC